MIRNVLCLLLCILCTVALFAAKPGDVNRDSSIDIVDALLVAQYYVGNSVAIDTQAADVDYSGTIDIVDALQIARFYVGLITHFNNIDSTPSNPGASDAAKKVLAYLAELSTDSFNGVIAGQNCYHGDQITSSSTFDGYNSLVTSLFNQTNKWIGMIGLDYEHDRIFTPEQLANANKVLIAHWQKGGLVTVNWSPHNPWINDESDIYNNPGDWQNTRTSSPKYDASVVNLKNLADPTKAIFQVWRKKLNRIAVALKELRDAGVVVLWRPMQEMNGNWFWWGVASHPNDPAPYINLIRDMYVFFTKDKGLDNLLWVYSPNAGGNSDWLKPVDWLYPGNDYVDIVAGTAYNDALTIADYVAYVKMGKPMGMGEFGPDSTGTFAKTGTFDDRKYLEVIKNNYPCVAYWVSWHNWDNGDGTQALMSINKNLNANELLASDGIITLDNLIPGF
jgi:mannan endo-1,4-beta-mannosidase